MISFNIISKHFSQVKPSTILVVYWKLSVSTGGNWPVRYRRNNQRARAYNVFNLHALIPLTKFLNAKHCNYQFQKQIQRKCLVPVELNGSLVLGPSAFTVGTCVKYCHRFISRPGLHLGEGSFCMIAVRTRHPCTWWNQPISRLIGKENDTIICYVQGQGKLRPRLTRASLPLSIVYMANLSTKAEMKSKIVNTGSWNCL